MWEPFASQGRQAGGRVIAGGPPDEHGTNFTIASTKAVEDPKRAAALKDYLERLRRGYEWAKANPDEFAKAWSEETGLPEKVTREAVPGKVVQIRAVTDADVKNQQDLADLLAEEKVIPGKVDFGGDRDPWPDHREGGKPMTLSLHWFLPTSGDARAILGAGGKVGAHHRRAGRRHRRAGARHRLPGPDRPLGGAAGLRGRADAHGLVV